MLGCRSIATLDIERPALLVQKSTGQILTTSLQDVPPTYETIIGNSGTLGKAFDQKRLKPMQDSTLPLTDAPCALAAHGLATTYQRLWVAVVAGQVPGVREGD